MPLMDCGHRWSVAVGAAALGALTAYPSAHAEETGEIAQTERVLEAAPPLAEGTSLAMAAPSDSSRPAEADGWMRLWAEAAAAGPGELRARVTALADARGDVDRALIDPLLVLFDAGAPRADREAAAARLAEIQDPRAVIPLIYAIHDLDLPVRVAAVQALGRYVLPQVEQALAGVVRGQAYPLEVRAAAAASLGAQKTETARTTLLETYRGDKYPREVRSAAGEALETNWPGYLATLGESGKVVDRRGRYLLVPASAGFGAYAMGTIGRFGQSDASVPIGILSGLVLGGASSFLLTQRQEMTMAQAGSIVSGGGWGLWSGITAGRAATLDRCQAEEDAVSNWTPEVTGDPWTALVECQSRSLDLVMLGGLLGEAVGLTATSLTLKHNPYTFGDVITINLGGLAVHNALLGADMFFDPPRDLTRGKLTGLIAGSLAGLTGTGLVTRHMRFSRGDVALTAQGAMQGAWIGGWLAPLFYSETADYDEDSQIAGGVLLGSSLGMVGAAYLAQHTDFRVADNLFMTTGSVYGYMLGLGLPLIFDSSSTRANVASMLGGGVLGLGAAITLRDDVSFTGGDAALTALGTGWGLWQGIGLASYLNERSATLTSRQRDGAAFLGTVIGGVGTMALSQRVEVSPWEVLMLSSGGMWGAWFAVWGSILIEPENGPMLPALIASDAGLATAALLLSPKVGVHPTRLGWVNLGGLTGTALFSLGAALLSSDQDTIITANLAGGVVGLVAGSIVASQVKVDRPRSPEKVGLALQRIGRWSPQLSMQPWMVAAPGGAMRNEGWMLNLSLRQPVH